MKDKLTIPCPSCDETIAFNPTTLLTGKKLTCSHCQTVISLNEDNVTKATDIIKKIEDLKKNA